MNVLIKLNVKPTAKATKIQLNKTDKIPGKTPGMKEKTSQRGFVRNRKPSVMEQSAKENQPR